MNFDSKEFIKKFTYDGKLGVTYNKSGTTFRLYAPISERIQIKLYDENHNLLSTSDCRKIGDGVFEITIAGNLDNHFYTYLIDDKVEEIVDPYATAVSANGVKGAIIDFESTNPKGWDVHKNVRVENIVDAVLYETHVRDLTVDDSSSVSEKYKGKFLGIVEHPKRKKDVFSIINYIKDLGVNYVHLLPVYDFGSVDEINNINQYNWGYDPLHYNALEGSYSTDPSDPKARVKEFKQMIKTMHDNGLNVVLDVVYNHTFKDHDSNFNKITEHFYHRTKDGEFSNGSACGNEIASERPMVKKFIVDSILHYANEYKVDGFRFDLMGLIDIKTMNEIREELDKIDKNIIIYGEGWCGGATTLPVHEQAVKDNVTKLDNIACFNDVLRDSIKGNVFYDHDKGFVCEPTAYHHNIERCLGGSRDLCFKDPTSTINYCSAHDNNTLRDKLVISCNKLTEDELKKMTVLSASIVMMSQGIPFFMCGEEFLRTKQDENGNLIENSYNAGDFVNKIDWTLTEKYSDVVNEYRKLITLRREHNMFRLRSTEEINKAISFKKNNDGVIIYTLENEKECLLIAINANKFTQDVNLEDYKISGDYKMVYQCFNDKISDVKGHFVLPSISTTVLKKIK